MKVAIIGVGNELRGDDGIGVFLAGELEKELGKPEGIMIIKTQVPENFIAPIMEFGPGKVIILDSADFKGRPGEFRVIRENEIMEFLVSTHNMPLTVFLKALENLKAKKILIGIQPKGLDFGTGLSREVREKAGDVLGFVRTLL
jgi:hydrogenase 3 maturation protease